MKCTALLVVSTAFLVGTAAHAHHSFAMFDQGKVVTLTGTIKEVQWTNPHVWLQILVPATEGSEEWGIEGGPPNILKKLGMQKDSLHPGDKVILKAHPLKDGSKGGSLMEITRPDGTPIYVEKFQL